MSTTSFSARGVPQAMVHRASVLSALRVPAPTKAPPVKELPLPDSVRVPAPLLCSSRPRRSCESVPPRVAPTPEATNTGRWSTMRSPSPERVTIP